jgi:hypothetical protein
MSKNTGTSELINYFDLGVNGDVGISGSLTLDTIANAVIDTDKFLVSDNGIIKYRTGAELLSDIGVAGNYVTIDTAQTITGIKTFSGTNLQLESSGSADATILRNTSGVTGSTSNSNTIGFNGVNNIFVSTQNRGGFILGFNNSVQNREYTLPDASGTIALTSSIPANPVGGTGTTNYLPKFTGASTIGNSIVSESGSLVSVIANSAGLRVTESGGADVRMVAGGSSGFFGTYSNHPLQFLTDSGTKMTLTSTGNLGLGVTPSAWLSVYRAFQIGVGGGISGRTDSGLEMQLLGNAYRNTSGNYIYSTTDKAARFVLDGDASFGWYNAPSGTAGNAISFTQAMTLTSGGNLLVGTTTDNGARLQVSGTATISGSLTTATLTTIGTAVAGQNVQLNLNGVSGKAQRIEFQNSGAQQWLIGAGAASETTAFEIFNSTGIISLSINKSTNAATFSSFVTASYFKAISGGAYSEYIYDGIYSTGTDQYINTGGAYNTRFITNGTERMRITSSGNVIGVTPN